MRIAIVYHLPNPGGVTRFTHALIDGLLAVDAELSIDYFVSDRLMGLGRTERFLETGRVRLIGISDPLVVSSNLDDPDAYQRRRGSIAGAIGRRLQGHPGLHARARHVYRATRSSVGNAIGRPMPKEWYEFKLPAEHAANLSSYDVVYLPFPYYMEPAAISAPIVGTFHDFNQLHFPENFGWSLLRQMKRQLTFWTARADDAVVSTRFIQGELFDNFPRAKGHSSIVYVAPYSTRPLTEEARVAALAKFGLGDQDYLIYPSNHSYHKNLTALVRAADVMKRRDGRLAHPVVFTGFGTDGIGLGKWPSFAELDQALAESSLVLGTDVRGLGFVTDEEVDALTRSARMVVSTSLYEAGCGPALDAWKFGVPVAFSSIPPFVEQLDALGVEAWVFDPRNPADIARVLDEALGDREEALARAARSRAAIDAYTWETAARGYLGCFERAIERYRSRAGGRREAAASDPR